MSWGLVTRSGEVSNDRASFAQSRNEVWEKQLPPDRADVARPDRAAAL